MYTEIFKTNKVSKDYKLAILSDIHYHPHFNIKILNKLKDNLLLNKPDLICLVGDILDDSGYTNIDSLINWINELSEITPVIIVLGNHDKKTKRNNRWIQNDNNILQNSLIDNSHIIFLEDSIYKLDNIVLYGFSLSFKHYEIDYEDYTSFVNEVNNLKVKLNSNNYNIVLFHSPININKYRKENNELTKSDLIISGHMHNSCIPYYLTHPFNKLFKTTRGIISPSRDLFPKYSQGRDFEANSIIYEGITKFSKCNGFINKLDWLYPKHVLYIVIKNDK